MNKREALKQSQRWVVKIGSSLITRDGQGLAQKSIDLWAKQIAQLKQQNCEIILVSSGAVAEGMTRLGWSTRPHALHELQAAAAVGQMGLIQAYESSFQQHNIQTAQVLLTHADLEDRQRYLNARSTLKTLLKLNTLPIVNENDTVATDEIRFGDNDSLAALVANLTEADGLIILTDQQGLYEEDPRQNPQATLIAEARAGEPSLDKMAGGSPGHLGRGGMITKLQAAKKAARSGTYTIIASGKEPEILTRLHQGEVVGTLLSAGQETLTARKRWLAGNLKPKGSLSLDDGAVKALTQSGKSLLPVGVQNVQGNFKRGDLVLCIDKQGQEIARGLVNYDSTETQKIQGHASDQIEQSLGYLDELELIHRDNLVVTQ